MRIGECRAALCLATALAMVWIAVLPPAEDPRAVSAELAGVSEEGNAPCVALTFDDGPRAETTPRLLEGLRARGVQASFFLIGEQIPGNEWILRQMAADGHQIGNHTYTHTKLQGATATTVVQEINKTEVLLNATLGEGIYWLRPPYGLADEQTGAIVKTPMIYWSLDPEDWKILDTEKVVQRVCSQVQNGDIILLHDFYPTSVDAALEIVDCLQARGYHFFTVRDLLLHNGVTAQPGEFYRNGSGT